MLARGSMAAALQSAMVMPKPNVDAALIDASADWNR